MSPRRRIVIAAGATATAILTVVLVNVLTGPPTKVKPLQLCSNGLIRIASNFCTHGTDPPTAIDCPIITCIVLPTLPRTDPQPPPACIGDGFTGARIHLFYAWKDADDSAEWAPYIRGAAGTMDRFLAARGGQHYRFLCSAGQVVVTPIHVGDQRLGAFITAARAQGHTRTDRIYSAVGRYGSGGSATLDTDDSASTSNKNNVGPAYSWTTGAGNWATLMHEVGHNLGAVQLSAPHSTGAYHCWDENDIMCYADQGPTGKTTIRVCQQTEWDCRQDDYFNTSPLIGSYLATHWNLADSIFLTP